MCYTNKNLKQDLVKMHRIIIKIPLFLPLAIIVWTFYNTDATKKSLSEGIFMNKLIKKITALAMAVAMSTATMSVVADAAWVKTDTGYKYQNEDGSYAKSKWITAANGNKYYVKSDGTMAKGLLKLKSSGTTNYYYFDNGGVMRTGWQNVNGSVYYFKSTGKAVCGKKIVIGDYSYKFDSTGVWNGKVYSKNGKKDVTSTVNVEQLVPASVAKGGSPENKIGKVKKVEGEIPETITIKGQTFKTNTTNNFIGNKADPIYPDGGKYTQWYINIAGCTDADLECLKYMSNLESLDLIAYDPADKKSNKKPSSYDTDNYALITNLDFAYYMPNLKSLTIDGAPYLTDISGLSACKNLDYINLDKCGIKNLDGLENLKRIKEFRATQTRLENLNGLKNCANLRNCSVTKAYLTDITGLSNKKKLKTLHLSVNRRLQDITPLKTSFDSLTILGLGSCTAINTWEVLTYVNVELMASDDRYGIGAAYRASTNDVCEKYLNQLRAQGVSCGSGGAGDTMSDDKGTVHNLSREFSDDRLWDYEMRPKTVVGDNTCNCKWCKETKQTSELLEMLSHYE